MKRRVLVLLAVVALLMSATPAAVLGSDPDDVVTGSGDAAHQDPVGGVDLSDGLESLDLATRGIVSSGPSANVIKNLSLVSRGARLSAGSTTDVWAHQGFAYIGTFNSPCGDGTGANGSGVRVFDVKNPSKTKPAGHIPSVAGSRINDVKAATMGSGNILVHSNEPCAGGPGGFEVYNVDNPKSPVHLAHVQVDDSNATLRNTFGVVDVGVHNLFLFRQGSRDLVALQAEGEFGSFQIYDLTVPTAPAFVGAWGAEELCTLSFCSSDPENETDPDVILDTIFGWMRTGFGLSQNKYLHDMTISADGTKAYLSSWDAGLVLLDINDPSDPTVVSVAIDPVNGSLDGEVNSHAAWPTADGKVVVETEEDFNSWASILVPTNFTVGTTSPGNTIPGVSAATSTGNAFQASQTGNNVTVNASSITVNGGPLAGSVFGAAELLGSQPKFSVTGPVTAEAVWIGRACNGDALLNSGSLDPGDVAVVRRGTCSFAEKMANASGAGAGALVITNNVVTDTPWGGVRIWDYSDPANPVLASTFDTVCSASPTPIAACDPRGTYSVHNVIVEGKLAYLSWYSDGVLILDISDPYNPVEVARYHRAGADFEASNGGIQNVWGIYKVPEQPWIYASDRNGGLYVLKAYGAGSTGKK